jgi:hypothetical protein
MTSQQDDFRHAESSDNALMEREYEQLLLTVLNDISDAMKRNDTLRLLFNMAWATGVRMNVKIQPLKTRS